MEPASSRFIIAYDAVFATSAVAHYPKLPKNRPQRQRCRGGAYSIVGLRQPSVKEHKAVLAQVSRRMVADFRGVLSRPHQLIPCPSDLTDHTDEGPDGDSLKPYERQRPLSFTNWSGKPATGLGGYSLKWIAAAKCAQ